MKEGSPDNATGTAANRIEARVLRWKLTRWTLSIAVFMLGAAWWIDGTEQPNLLYLENFSWIAGSALLVMGLWRHFRWNASTSNFARGKKPIQP